MKRILSMVLACLFVLPAVLQAAESSTDSAAGMPRVVLETNLGNIEVECFADKAPKTVENFLRYVREGKYDGTIFHRVISGFVIQGGGFDSMMRRGETREPIANEARSDVPNSRGTLAMARTGDPHSATNQFFINLKDNDFLNHTAPNRKGFGYCVFGRVVGGMKVVDKIASVPTQSAGQYRDVPATPVVIVKAYVVGEKAG